MNALNLLSTSPRATGLAQEHREQESIAPMGSSSFSQALQEQKLVARAGRRAQDEESQGGASVLPATSDHSTSALNPPSTAAPAQTEERLNSHPRGDRHDVESSTHRLSDATADDSRSLSKRTQSAGQGELADVKTAKLEDDIRALTASSRELAASILAHRRLQHATTPRSQGSHVLTPGEATTDVHPQQTTPTSARLAATGADYQASKLRAGSLDEVGDGGARRRASIPSTPSGSSAAANPNHTLNVMTHAQQDAARQVDRLLPAARHDAGSAGSATRTVTTRAAAVSTASASRWGQTPLGQHLSMRGETRLSSRLDAVAELGASSPNSARHSHELPPPVLGNTVGTTVSSGHGDDSFTLDSGAAAVGSAHLTPTSGSPFSFATPSAGMPLTMGTATLVTPFAHPQWAATLGHQIQSLARELRDGTHQIELRLDPPQLGPLRVNLHLFDGQAQLYFASHHAAVRQAVEAALPQLHDAFAQAGISLGETSVGEHFREAFAESSGSQTDQRTRGTPGGNNDEHVSPSPGSGPRSPRGLVDTFA